MIFRKTRASKTPSQPRSESTVTVEDLLQFKKRAEQPEPEFWTDFERQLKHRQLAAAIRKDRPWWHAIPRITAIALPAGASAALAIGIVVWRGESSAPQPPEAFARQPAAPADVAAPPVAPATALAHSAAPVARQQQTPAVTAPALAAAAQQAAKPVSAAEAAASRPVETRHIEAARNAFASVTPPAQRARVTPAAAFATGSLFNTKPATAKNTSPAALLAAPRALATDMVAAVQTVLATNEISTLTASDFSPLPKAEEHMDPRRERLLTYTDTTIPVAAPMADNPRVIRMRDRVTSRFNDKSFTDSISRVATTGDSFTIKF